MLSASSLSGRSTGYQFLVADDEELLRRLLAKLLVSQGHKVVTAPDGDAALELFTRYRPDIVISDIRMPGMDGIALAEEIRAQDPEAEIILITAYADTEMVVEALRKGVSNFVAKPFELKTLLTQIEPSLMRLGLRLENECLREEVETARRRQEARARSEATAWLLAGLARGAHVPLDLANTNAEMLEQLLARGRKQGRLDQGEIGEGLQLAEELRSCTRRVQAMVLDIDRFLTPRDPAAPRVAHLAETVSRTMEDLEEHRPVHVETHLALPEPDLAVLCDPIDLYECLTRVIRNAYDALESSGSQVRVFARLAPYAMGTVAGFLEVGVEDDGPGVPRGIIDEVFVPFFSTRETGIGLGLSLALEACRRNGGEMDLSNGEGGGTRVTLRLPLASSLSTA
ncbi:MAG: response regulator [Deltaproteobacteria bacterium]|nr:response regulator [Deltaproteobacteria bacterium]